MLTQCSAELERGVESLEVSSCEACEGTFWSADLEAVRAAHNMLTEITFQPILDWKSRAASEILQALGGAADSAEASRMKLTVWQNLILLVDELANTEKMSPGLGKTIQAMGQLAENVRKVKALDVEAIASAYQSFLAAHNVEAVAAEAYSANAEKLKEAIQELTTGMLSAPGPLALDAEQKSQT